MSPSTRRSSKKNESVLSPRKYSKRRQLATSKASRKQAVEEADSDASVEDTDVKTYDSDALDDDSEAENHDANKRKRGKTTTSKKSPQKRRRTKRLAQDEVDLEEGQEIVGVVVEAPKTGRVPAGQISNNTLNFLRELKKPECNDRQWFKLHEPVYRLAEKEWKDFVEDFTSVLAEVDPQVPHLPPNDVIHRIYRDIRFSNDKTPYKTGLSASFSRSGRKGIFAGYHIAVKPDGESLIAAGSWCPGRNELATIRANILRDSSRLRQIISAPEFVEIFGDAKPQPDGTRSNIFGMDDELKVAPKGIDKNHRDIDLLKCRSFAVVHRFLDSEVLDADFKNKLADVAKVMMPLVHCLNDMMTIPPDDEDNDGSGAGSDHGSEA